MGLNFKIRFAFFHTCGSREQCTGPTKKKKKTLETCNVLSKLTLNRKPPHTLGMMVTP